jgi:phage terminase large subunit
MIGLPSASVAVARKLRSWREPGGILRFVNEELKATPDPWQEEALLAFASPDPTKSRISLQACAGPGKSAVLAWCGWWFVGALGERDEHPKGAATSITGDNLKTNLWAEFAKWQARSPYLSSQFTWTASGIFCNDAPATWRLDPKAWPKTANADEQGKTLSGLHAKYVAVLVDESGAIPSSVLRAGEQALSTCAFGKILQAGNPISLEGMLHAAATSLRHQWYVIRITGDPDEPGAWVHAARLAPLHRPDAAGHCACPACWARQQIDTYGRDNPWVKSYILGQFPPASINALLGVEEVEAAMARHYARDVYADSQKRIGVDIARFGDDRTVIFPRQGIAAFRPVIMRVVRTTNIAARVAKGFNDWDAELILIDDTGHWGHGVVDSLITSGYPCIPIIASDPALDRRYKNRRAEMWLEMAKWVRAGGALPHMPDLIRELTAPTYTFLNGKFVLEDKDLVKQRLGQSPDLADGLAQTFAIPDQPGKLMAFLRNTQTTTHDYDPFARPGEPGSVSNAGGQDFNPFEPR